MVRFAHLVFFAALAAIWGGDTHAASFDCKKAANDMERRICDDPDLGSLDSQLQAAYQGALDRSNHPEEVKAQQLAWLKQREAHADNKSLSASYLAQIKLLSTISDKPVSCNGSSTPEIEACEAEYSRRADRELARYVAAARKRLMDEAKNEPTSEASRKALAQFNSSQAAWEKYRKAECDADYEWWSEGTIRGTMYETCWQTVTKSRSADIRSTWLTFMDDTPPLMPTPVEVR